MADVLEFTTGYWMITSAADWSQFLVLTDENDVPYDLTGSTFLADLALTIGGSVVKSLTTANGGVDSTDLENGQITLNIVEGDLPAGVYYGDLYRVIGGANEFMMRLEVTVRLGS